jgi:hypothetical protein
MESRCLLAGVLKRGDRVFGVAEASSRDQRLARLQALED